MFSTQKWAQATEQTRPSPVTLRCLRICLPHTTHSSLPACPGMPPAAQARAFFTTLCSIHFMPTGAPPPITFGGQLPTRGDGPVTMAKPEEGKGNSTDSEDDRNTGMGVRSYEG